jgi:RNA polymerase sigma-70 factor (ECF subfamily)
MVDMQRASLDTGDARTRKAPSVDLTRSTRFLAGMGPHLDRSYRLAGLLLGNAHEAEDAVQEALVAAWQAFDDLHDAERFNAWFDRILVNGCRDRLRRRKTIQFVPIDPTFDRAIGDPFRVLIDRDALLVGMNRLTTDERVVIVLRFWGDLPLEEIGDRLGWPLGTVKSRLHRALERLRAGFAADDTEEVRR